MDSKHMLIDIELSDLDQPLTEQLEEEEYILTRNENHRVEDHIKRKNLIFLYIMITVSIFSINFAVIYIIIYTLVQCRFNSNRRIISKHEKYLFRTLCVSVALGYIIRLVYTQ